MFRCRSGVAVIPRTATATSAPHVEPSNILIDAQTLHAHLIDFGIAIRLRQDGVVATSPTALEGTLAYIAPEQTGRVNRGVDARSDLYSLGVTLFEMLTGTLPFAVTEPGELLHNHIARKPPSPRAIRPSIPEVLSNIVLKLLNKMAEDRYQSALGLRNDLQTCLHSWLTVHTIPEFVLGSHDRPSELRLPQKLYGQKAELTQLGAALERVRGGALELVLLSGPAGSGKTALVSELAQPLAQRGGYLTRACFDPQGIPYAPLLDACRDLLRLLLTEPAHSLQARKERFLQALGGSGHLLIKMLPELELVIGEQPEVAPLPPAESQNRFGLLFQNFLRQFASAQHPLVLFLDDLQYADPASWQLIRLLLTDPYGHYLLVVGAYREQSADSSTLLQQQLTALRKERVVTTTVALQPLVLEDITALLADALATPPAALTELAHEILIKTHGSPFFVHQFLGALGRERLLKWSPETGDWWWDLPRIQTLTATDNVADFMITTLQRLSANALTILQRAACIGTQFDLPTLAELCQQSVTECASALETAVHLGLILSLDSSDQRRRDTSDSAGGLAESGATYKFVHERVQQATYAMLGELPRQELHLQIGQLRLRSSDKDTPTSKLFDLVYHLNLGSPRLIATGDEPALLELAQLNLSAGYWAKSTAAFHAAHGFFTIATTLLPESAWESQHTLLFELHYERAQMEILLGNFAAAETQLLALHEHAVARVEHGRAHLQLCELYTTRGDFVRATEAGIEGLEPLGVVFPTAAEDAQAAFHAERSELAALIGDRRIQDLVSLPINQSAEINTALSILMALNMPAYMCGSPLYPLIMARQLTLALRYGLGEQTSYACAAYGFFIATMLGEPARASEFGELALALNQRIPNPGITCRIEFALGTFLHSSQPLKVCHEHLIKAEQAGLQSGDFASLSVACSSRAQLFYYTTESLNESLRETEDYMVLMQRTQDALGTLLLTHVRQLLRALVGQTFEPTSFSDAGFDEAALWSSFRQANATYGMNHLAWLKLTLLCLFGKYEEACTLGIESEAWFAAAPGIAFHTERVFMFCLALIAHYPSLPESERSAYDVRIDRYASSKFDLPSVDCCKLC